MRDKFSDLVAQGFASFDYTPISKDIPEQDPICRMYNNVFSIPTDTHMSMLDDGTRVITGHMIANDLVWNKFLCSYCWFAVDFRQSGAWSLCDFFYRHGLKGEKSILNGDIVYKVTPIETRDEICKCPLQAVTSESNIPTPISFLTNSGNKLHILECFNGNAAQVVENMNNSVWVKGNHWVVFENQIVGLVGDKVYKLNLK